MSSYSRTVIAGNLGQDPEVRYTGSGTAICNLRVATEERFQKDGEWQSRTEWHRVSVWGPQAEKCGEYLRKGAKVLIEGRNQTRSYDKDGEKRYVTEIRADRVVFLDSRSGSGGGEGGYSGGGGGGYRGDSGQSYGGGGYSSQGSTAPVEESDIPF